MYKYPEPKLGDVFEETDVHHGPRRFVVTGPFQRETEWSRPAVGLRRIKPNGQEANTTGMYCPERLRKGQGMRLVERGGKPYVDTYATP